VKRAPAWPAFAAYGVAFATCLVAGQEMVLAVARLRSAGNAARLASEASRFALSAPGLGAVALLDALVLAALALATAHLLDPRAAIPAQLALGASRASPLGVVASTVGVTGLSFACGAMADLLGMGQGPVMHAVEDALAASAGPWAFCLAIVALAVAPGLAEETFFRGLMQTRIAAAWGRWPAIVAAAAAFGALHLDPVQGVLAFLVGLLLGWIASRFESIRPAVAAHVANNALFVGLAHFRLSSTPPGGALVALGVGGVATLASIAVARSPRALRASTRAS
jgi:membrane protease YdiL (CAAX protease family)